MQPHSEKPMESKASETGSYLENQAPRLPELLAPAGTMAAFKAALAAGADAIYCGLESFNARRNADNLTLDDLEHACDLAHLAGSRVYVTTNILVRDAELPDALGMIRNAWEAGADAFIIQDWGLLHCVHELWPQIEIHLSTQANVGDPLGVDFALKQGCARVTLSRELTLQEIARCAGRGADIEVFCHGALCVCYSGQCLLSSSQRGRSANRGLCRQPCRLPYELLDESGNSVSKVLGTRLLSPRDYRTIFDLPALCATGVGALKIEGRMKAPDYVFAVVSSYRQALDLFGSQRGSLMRDIPSGSLPQDGSADDAWKLVDASWRKLIPDTVDRTLRRAFNRDFTDGYLFHVADNSMMSYARGNNRGQYVGKVIETRSRDAVIELCEPVDKDDLLEVRDSDNFDNYVTAPVPNAAKAGAKLRVRLARPMPLRCDVRLIRNGSMMTAARNCTAATWPRKRAVEMAVRARLGKPLEIRATTLDGDAHPDLRQNGTSGCATGSPVEAARTTSLGADDIVEHVGRMGSSPFEPASWNIDLDEGVGMGFAELHGVRSRALEDLERNLLEPWKGRKGTLAEAPYSLHLPTQRQGYAGPDSPRENPMICALVATPEQEKAARASGASRIYALAEDLLVHPAASCVEEGGQKDAREDFTGWGDGIVAVVSEVPRSSMLELAERIIAPGSSVAVGNVAGLELACEKRAEVEVWDTLELHNAWSLLTAEQKGADFVWFSPELDMLELTYLKAHSTAGGGIVVMGRQRQMTTEHCVLQSLGPCAHACESCARRRELHTLRDEFGRTSLVTSDVFGRSRLWSTTPLDATPQTGELLRAGFSRFLVDARLMDANQTSFSVRHAKEALDAALAGRPPAPRLARHESGHLFSRIG